MQENTDETAHSENGGHSGGQFESESKTVASLKLRALTDLIQAIESVDAWIDVAQLTAESIALQESLQAIRQLIWAKH